MRRAPIALGVRRPQPQPDMNQQIIREILWNVPVAFRILLYAMLVAWRDTAGQGNVIRETWGWIHCAFCVGLLGLFIGTTIIFFNDGIAEAAYFSAFPITRWA
jgi:hypothetical protein